MDHVLNLIKSRRSTRKFSDRAVPQECLLQVLEAGRYAPSGKNVQKTHFLVIKNKAVLDRLAELVRQAFSRTTDAKSSSYVFHYNPNVLIITANALENDNNLADCSCALENMMLMTNALDLGSCWINQLHWLDENPEIRAFLARFGVTDEETICGALAVGYADTADGLPERTPLPRREIRITHV